MRKLIAAAVAALTVAVSSVTVLAGPVHAGGSGTGGDVPDLVGTWTGKYQFPLGDDEVIDATETLIIERQKGRLIWGTDDYVEDGQTIKIPVRGTIGRDGHTIAIAEENGYFMAELRGPNRMHVWFVRVDDQFTAFEVVLRRAK